MSGRRPRVKKIAELFPRRNLEAPSIVTITPSGHEPGDALMDRIAIARAARYLVGACGPKAAPQAEQNIDWAEAHDDFETAANWALILREIHDIQADEVPVHEGFELSNGGETIPRLAT
jgi:hypothetical protein